VPESSYRRDEQCARPLVFRESLAGRRSVLVRKTPTPFTLFAKGTSRLAGRPATFTLAVLLVCGWAITGPYFDYSNAWQLTVNTATTIVTFLMVFLIQATQNRDAEAIQVKLDEIIRSLKGARNELLDSEEMEEEDLTRLREKYLRLAEKARTGLGGAPHGAEVPELEEKASGITPHLRRREDRAG
jgi:low affinity Fe/Cu permease